MGLRTQKLSNIFHFLYTLSRACGQIETFFQAVVACCPKVVRQPKHQHCIHIFKLFFSVFQNFCDAILHTVILNFDSFLCSQWPISQYNNVCALVCVKLFSRKNEERKNIHLLFTVTKNECHTQSVFFVSIYYTN